jgi:hypothetical protein
MRTPAVTAAPASALRLTAPNPPAPKVAVDQPGRAKLGVAGTCRLPPLTPVSSASGDPAVDLRVNG